MITLIILLGSYFILALFKVKKVLRGRLAMAVLLIFTGSAHFYKTEEMSRMLPEFVQYKVIIIYVTGLLQLLGAIGILIPSLQKLAGICLMIMFIGFLPANIYAAFNHVDFGGHIYGPRYLLFRIPLQLFFVWWIYRYTIKLPKTS